MKQEDCPPGTCIVARVHAAMARNRAALDRLGKSEEQDFKPFVQQYPDIPALYLYLTRPSRKSGGIKTVQAAESVLLDYDKETGELLGIEVLLPEGKRT